MNLLPSEPPISVSKKTILWLRKTLKVAVTSFFIIYIIYVIPLDSLNRAVNTLSPRLLSLVFLVLVLQKIVIAMSLQQLLLIEKDVAFSSVLTIDSVGAVMNSIIPTQAGALVSVPLIIEKYLGFSKKRAAILKTVQFSSLAVFTGLTTLFGVVYLHRHIAVKWSILLIGASMVYMIIPITVYVFSRWEFKIPSRFSGFVPSFIERGLSADFGEMPRRSLAIASIFQGIGVFCISLRFYLIGTAVGIQGSILFFSLVPVTMYSLSIYPVSMNGVGIVDAAGIIILEAFGIGIEAAAAVIILDRVLGTYLPLVISGVIGAVGWRRFLSHNEKSTEV